MAEEEKVTPVAGEATSMADYEKELEASFKKIEEGDMITGTVIAVDEEEITLLYRKDHQGFRLQHALSKPAFGWLLAGGIIYTIGGIVYALKVPIFNAKHKNFGSHEIFHLFVMGGSACHFVTMFLLA